MNKNTNMENLNNSAESQSESDSGNSKEVKKRTSYVSRDHESMMNFVSTIYKNLGHTDYHSNKSIASVLSLSPDSIKQHLTSSQQYKLLEIKFGTGYKITELFKTIFLPLNDSEMMSAVIESIKAPETYTQLFNEYEGHILPPQSGLKNHFVRNFHFKEDIAEKTAEIFISNLKYYNLLNARGVLTLNPGIKRINYNNEPAKNVEDEKREEKKEEISNEFKPVNVEIKGMIDIVIPLKTSKEKAHLLIPEDYQEEDLQRIAKFVEALK
jgi:hypothetical protein